MSHQPSCLAPPPNPLLQGCPPPTNPALRPGGPSHQHLKMLRMFLRVFRWSSCRCSIRLSTTFHHSGHERQKHHGVDTATSGHRHKAPPPCPAWILVGLQFFHANGGEECHLPKPPGQKVPVGEASTHDHQQPQAGQHLAPPHHPCRSTFEFQWTAHSSLWK